jgi:hypothetical protein
MDTGMSIDRPQRPPIERVKTGAELKDWYGLKTEAMNHARLLGISASGGKFDIIDRIADFLDAKPGAMPPLRASGRASKMAGFDWHGAPLLRTTLITANYRNTQNVRRFFFAEIGRHFSFNIAFMAWMKAHEGKTLDEAAEEWRHVHALTKAGEKPAIPFHNQFNAYVRAFCEDNPGRPIDDARHFWKLKCSFPGHNRYQRSDLDLGE